MYSQGHLYEESHQGRDNEHSNYSKSDRSGRLVSFLFYFCSTLSNCLDSDAI